MKPNSQGECSPVDRRWAQGRLLEKGKEKKKKQSCNTEGLGEQEEVRTGSKAEIKPGLEFWPLPTSFLGGGLEEVVSLEGAALWYRISAL